jgi:predicted glycosyltransferase
LFYNGVTINKDHHGYQLYNNYSKLLFPNNLLCFGTNDKEFFKTSTYIDYENVFEVGSYYLEHIKNSNPISIQFDNIRKKYSVLIAITGQDAYDDVLLAFVHEVLNLKKEWGVVFIPRSEKEEYYRNNYQLNENIHFVNDLNTYELIKLCDVHTTVNSTCALESVAIGTPNVLFDYNKKASSYLANLLTNSITNSFCDTPEEYLASVEKELGLSRDEVIRLNSSLFVTGYSNNLESFFKSFS